MTVTALVRGAALYTAGNLLPKVGALLLLPILVGHMTPSEFGAFSLLLSISTLLGIVYRLGLDAALMRLHFDVAGPERGGLYRALTLTALLGTVAFTVVAALILGPLFPTLFVGIPFLPYGALMLAFTAANTFQFVPTVWMRASEQPGRFVIYGFGVFAVTVLVTLLAVVGADLGLTGALIGQLAGGLFSLASALWVVWRLPGGGAERSVVRPALRFSLPLLPHQLGAWALNVSDRWLIGLLIGLPIVAAQAAIGVYSLGYQLANVITLVAVSLQAAWIPIFYRHAESAVGARFYRSVSTVSIALLSVLTVFAVALAPDVIDLLAPPGYAEAVLVMQIVAVAALFYGAYVMVVALVMYRRRTGPLAAITGAAAVANIAVNVVLIPRIGIVGAAWATLAAYALYAVATAWYGHTVYPFLPDLGRLGVLAVAGSVLLAIVIAFPTDPGSAISWVAHLGEGLLYAGLVAGICLKPLRDLTRSARSLTTPRAAPLPAGSGAD